MLKVLFVCTNAFVRAPIAAGLLQKLVDDAGKNADFQIEIAGTFAGSTSRGPDRRAIEICAKHGIDIAMFRTRELRAEDLTTFDRLVVLDVDSYAQAKELSSAATAKKIWLFREVFGDLSVLEIPDPATGAASFETVFAQLQQGIRNLAPRLLAV